MAMTVKQLRRLVAGGETLDVEFKGERRSPLNDRELVEAVVCLANRTGVEPGWLLIGIEDDGSVTGARFRHDHTTGLDKVAALIAARTRPALAVLSRNIRSTVCRFWWSRCRHSSTS